VNNSPFSSGFSEARSKFLNAADAAGATLSSYSHPENGPDGGALFTDCAWIGPKNALKVLVLVSGTHGVEGFCGSGAQIDWLSRREYALLGDDMAVLLIHAINPYGFAWKRRVTNENVDLNRNFVDFSAPLPANARYADIADALKPTDWSVESQSASRNILLTFIQENGLAALAQVVSGGQYTHANGLFYGGSAPTWSRITLEQIFSDHLSMAQEIGIVDYHTGLGPDGYAEPIVTSPKGSSEHLRALQWHGLATKCVDAGESVSAAIAGDWLAMAPGLLPHAQVTAIALEYGTVDSMIVLEALRADNWLHAHGDPAGPEAVAIKAQILAAFYTDTDVWRGMVLGQSLMTVRKAINGLAGMTTGL
jgi:hypothetical protein